MRIRSMKPEFWRSQDIADLRWEERLLFVGLWSYVDDNGVGRDDARIITADLFALDSGDYRETLARVTEGLSALAEHGRIVRYQVSGVSYVEIVNWDKHQKIDHPNKPRYPRSSDDSAEVLDPLAATSRNPREGFAPGTGEQGNRGTGEQSSSSEAADAAPRPEIIRLLDLLDAQIEANGGRKPSRTKKNIDAARLLLDRDGKTVDQVEAAIRWCQADEFWRGNILSMSKLREKYEQLRHQAARSKPTVAVPQSSALEWARRSGVSQEEWFELVGEHGEREARRLIESRMLSVGAEGA